MTNLAQIWLYPSDKSIDGVLVTQTRGGRMVGAEESTELWRHPIKNISDNFERD